GGGGRRGGDGGGEVVGRPQWEPKEPRAKRLPALFATGDDAEEIRPMTEEELERVAIATAIWNEAQDPRGTLAETYLQDHRKLDLPLDSNIFRFHPQCPWRDEDSGNVRVPALVAAFRSLDDDAITGIHRIALNPDGTKIDRRMLGIVRRSAIKLAAPCNGELVIAEGIETAMAAIKLGIGPAWALGSAGRFNFFTVLPKVRHLILDEESDEASRSAVKICARRWRRAGRRTSIVSSEFGSDLNDAVIEMVRVAQ